MYNRIASFTLVVRDYDEAIDFYTRILGFELLEDTPLDDAKRWVRVAPQGAIECSVLLAKANNDAQKAAIGHQTGGRVAFFLYTNDFETQYQRLLDHSVKIFRPKCIEPHGIIAVFEDLYGNLWDLIQPTK